MGTANNESSFLHVIHRYKESFTRLRSLKTEIDHLQHLLEKAKVKMQKDFEIWWAEQGAVNQVFTFPSDPILLAVVLVVL